MPRAFILHAFQGRPEEGGYCKRGDCRTFTAERIKALAANGLVQQVEAPDRRAAPVPQNKMAREPSNKGDIVEKTGEPAQRAAPKRRGPGRPKKKG